MSLVHNHIKVLSSPAEVGTHGAEVEVPEIREQLVTAVEANLLLIATWNQTLKGIWN